MFLDLGFSIPYIWKQLSGPCPDLQNQLSRHKQKRLYFVYTIEQDVMTLGMDILPDWDSGMSCTVILNRSWIPMDSSLCDPFVPGLTRLYPQLDLPLWSVVVVSVMWSKYKHVNRTFWVGFDRIRYMERNGRINIKVTHPFRLFI